MEGSFALVTLMLILGAGPSVGGDANGASQAGTTIRGMPTRKQLHQEVDAVPDHVNPIDDPWKDCVPFQGDVSDLVSLTHDLTDEQYEEQRAHWHKAREQLIAEGAKPGKYIDQLEAEAEARRHPSSILPGRKELIPSGPLNG